MKNPVIKNIVITAILIFFWSVPASLLSGEDKLTAKEAFTRAYKNSTNRQTFRLKADMIFFSIYSGIIKFTAIRIPDQSYITITRMDRGAFENIEIYEKDKRVFRKHPKTGQWEVKRNTGAMEIVEDFPDYLKEIKFSGKETHHNKKCRIIKASLSAQGCKKFTDFVNQQISLPKDSRVNLSTGAVEIKAWVSASGLKVRKVASPRTKPKPPKMKPVITDEEGDTTATDETKETKQTPEKPPEKIVVTKDDPVLYKLNCPIQGIVTTSDGMTLKLHLIIKLEFYDYNKKDIEIKIPDELKAIINSKESR